MSTPTVHVRNITPSTTESELSSFFSFCGKITSLVLTPETASPDSPLSATITFERDAAAKTAVLLDGTPLKNSPLKVEAAHSIDEIAGDHLAPNANIGPDGEIPQEAKPRATIFAEYLANGYVIGDSALKKGLELDHKHGITAKFAAALQSLDAKTHASDRAKTVEAQYHLTEKAANATSGLARYFENALDTGAGRRLRQFYQSGEKQVWEVHNEAKRLAELKKEKRRQSQEMGKTADGKPFVEPEKTTCACDANAGNCTCEPGKCACAGCPKKEGVSDKAEAEGKSSPAGQAQRAVEDVKGTVQDVAGEKA